MNQEIIIEGEAIIEIVHRTMTITEAEITTIDIDNDIEYSLNKSKISILIH